MAKMIGASGAWKSVCKELSLVNFYPEKISDVHQFLTSAVMEYENAKTNAEKDVQQEIELLREKVQNLRKNLATDIEQCRSVIAADIKLVRISIQILQEEKGIIHQLQNYLKISRLKKQLQSLEIGYEKCPQHLQAKVKALERGLELTLNNKDSLVDKKCRVQKSLVVLLQAVTSSSNLAGALAEVELIENLKKLPDTHYVVSDVKLELNRNIRFEGNWLGSAQIDLVVVSPAGIFVIEVKNWSKKFVDSNDYFDPYQQVNRASYLCYKLIGEKYNLKVRSIIAYRGSIPRKEQDNFIKSLKLGEVRSYIMWFRDQNASFQDVENIAEWLASKA